MKATPPGWTYFLPLLWLVYGGVLSEIAGHWRAGEYFWVVGLLAMLLFVLGFSVAFIDAVWGVVLELRQTLSPRIATTANVYRFVKKTEVDLYAFLVLTTTKRIQVDCVRDWLRWASADGARLRVFDPGGTDPDFDAVAQELYIVREILAEARTLAIGLDTACVCTLLLQYLRSRALWDSIGVVPCSDYDLVRELLSGERPHRVPEADNLDRVEFIASLITGDYDLGHLARRVLPD